MKRLIAFGIILLITSGVAAQSEEKAQVKEESKPGVEIPLKEIWANKMPGTRDIQDLDSENKQLGGKALLDSLAETILKTRSKLQQDEVTPPGFAVLGTGVDAFRNVNTIIVEGDKPRESFPFGSDLSLVFYSHQFSAYIQLLKVIQVDNVIEIQFRYVRTLDKTSNAQLAMIPLMQPAVGKYQVKFKELPPVSEAPGGGYKPLPSRIRERWKDKRLGDGFLSGDYSFQISD